MKTILMMGCALALLFAAVPQPVMAANSQMNLTVGTTNDAKAGDTVTVRLVGSNNPGLSTFAARLAYDDSDLEYVGTTWANTISSDSGNIELVSPVTENNQQALNLSAILNKTYSQNETIATVTFKAKNAYTTMPVTLTVREVTDASYNPVTVTTVVDASAGQTQSQSQSQSIQMIQTIRTILIRTMIQTIRRIPSAAVGIHTKLHRTKRITVEIHQKTGTGQMQHQRPVRSICGWYLEQQ